MGIQNRTQQILWRVGVSAMVVGLCTLGSVAVAEPVAKDEVAPPQEVPAAAATEKPAEVVKEPEEKVHTGTIASSGRFGTTGGVDVDSSGASPGDEVSVVSASIVRKSKNECVAKLNNNGKKTYSVSFTVIGEDRRGNKVISRTFSGSVAPKGTLERQVNSCREDLNLSVQLNSAKSGR